VALSLCVAERTRGSVTGSCTHTCGLHQLGAASQPRRCALVAGRSSPHTGGIGLKGCRASEHQGSRLALWVRARARFWHRVTDDAYGLWTRALDTLPTDARTLERDASFFRAIASQAYGVRIEIPLRGRVTIETLPVRLCEDCP
jgi:hypothetical protein